MKVLVVMPFKDKHKVLMAQNFPQVEFIYERNPDKELVENSGSDYLAMLSRVYWKNAQKFKMVAIK